MAEQKQRVVLPTTVRPSKYVLSLKPNFTDFTFEGTEQVHVEIKSQITEIVVNAIDLKINKVTYQASDSTTPVTASSISYDEPKESATFTFDAPLAPGTGILHTEFVGELNNKLKGFYRSKYTNTKGEDAYMAVTQFEPVDARRSFPCWDEPSLKATFVVELIVPKHLQAISNMPSNSEVESGDLRTVKFDESPIMSTYLLAFVIGEFDVISDRTSSGVDVRVFTPVGKKEQGRFALEVATKTLPFYNEYFGIPYPLPKCDLLAIPDFAAGAMENWGCVTYRETALLVDPKNSSASTKQWVALVVGHELAHQWFGNLVTMEWWTHLWLNEGFASWIEYLCVDHCFPNWDIWTQFVYSDLNRAFGLDSLISTHPVEVEVSDPAEIDEIFDIISYSKGSSIVRMLASFLGEESFKKGLNQYLNHFKYSNALTDDLWSHLEKSSGKPVSQLMNCWTKFEGYPVIFIDDSNLASGQLKIKQQRFLSAPSTSTSTSTSTLWWIPITILKENGEIITEIIKDVDNVVNVGDVGSGWIKVNPGQTGFYRVKYSDNLLSKLNEPIKNLTLSASDRIGIVGDAMALAKAGIISTHSVLDLLTFYFNENNYTVWADISANLGELSTILNNTSFNLKFQLFVNNLYRNIATSLGWDPKPNESHLDSLLRSLALGKLGGNGDVNTIQEAKKRFLQFRQPGQSDSLSADLRSVVYKICIQNESEGETFWEEVLKVFKESDLHEEKERCQISLGWTNNVDKLKKTLEFALSSDVRDQDTVFVLGSISANPKGRDLCWDFIKSNWDDLNKRFAGGFLLNRLVKSGASYFVTEERAVEVEKFFEEHKAPAAERSIQQALETIRLNAAWLKRDGPALERWLNEKF